MNALISKNTLLIVAGLVLIGIVIWHWQTEAQSPAEPIVITWEVAHEPVIYFERTAQKFKEIVEAETNGRVKVVINTQADNSALYGNGQFQSYNAGSLDKVTEGEIEMSQIYLSELTDLEPAFHAFELPFIFADHDEVHEVVESEIGSNMLGSLSEHGLKGLGFTYSGGLQVVVTTGKEIRSAEDFAGLTYRSFNSGVNQAIMDTLDVNATIANKLVDGERLLLSEQIVRGIVEAGDATYVDSEDTFFGPSKDLAKVFNQTHHKVLMTALVFNQAAFAALPADIQTAIEEAAMVAARAEREHIISDEAAVFERIKAAGITIVEMSEAERDRMREKLQPVYDEFEGVIGSELWNALMN